MVEMQTPCESSGLVCGWTNGSFARVGGGRMLRRDRTTGDIVADLTGRATLRAFG
jgi:hypothetical protein